MAEGSLCAVVFRRAREGLEVIVQGRVPLRGRVRELQFRFPGGQREEPQSPLETVLVTALSEIGLVPSNTISYWERGVSADPDDAQHVFLVSINDCGGTPHGVLKEERGFLFSPPEWVSIRNLMKRRSGLVPAHQDILIEAVSILRELGLYYLYY